MKDAGLLSGMLYPLLMPMTDQGLMQAKWRDPVQLELELYAPPLLAGGNTLGMVAGRGRRSGASDALHRRQASLL